MTQLSVPNVTGGEFQVMFLTIGGNVQTFIQSIDLTRTDGGADIKTLALGWAGRVPGAAMMSLHASGVVPYNQVVSAGPGAQGSGFANSGLTTSAGTQLDALMLTQVNTSSSQTPTQFIIGIGNPPSQQCFFNGYINNLKVSVAVGQQISYSFDATGSFSIFGSATSSQNL